MYNKKNIFSTFVKNIKNTVFFKGWKFFMNYKILNIKGALLDTQQLEDYLRKIASGHVLQDKLINTHTNSGD